MYKYSKIYLYSLVHIYIIISYFNWGYLYFVGSSECSACGKDYINKFDIIIIPVLM